MSAPRSWYEWLEALVAQFGTAKAVATYLDIDESKFSRWRRVYFQEPTALDLERLAERTRTPLPELLLMVHTALKAREQLTLRPPMGPAASPVVPLPKRRARRQTLTAWVCGLLTLGSGSAWATPEPWIFEPRVSLLSDIARRRGMIPRLA